MLDNISTKKAARITSADWREALTWGDIISFRFPIEGAGALPKKRPCLVLDVHRLGDSRYALLAYGTSADTQANRGYEVRLTEPEARAAGLHRPTRFVGARRMLVAVDHPDIIISAATDTPLIGRLTGAAFERMNAVRARIHAEADIAADRRSERRRTRQGRRRRAEARPATVERRHPHRRRLTNRG